MPAVVISVVVVIPVMVVFETTVRAVPVAAVEAATFMARADPIRAAVRRTGPIAAMPDVAAVGGVPVAFNPDKLRARADRYDVMSGRRRSADLNSDSRLGSSVMSANQEH